jgi:hypothetical protein
MKNYYLKDKEFNYIRYNSLPTFADYVIEFDKEYYRNVGVDICYNKSNGLNVNELKPFDSIFIKVDLLESSLNWLSNLNVPFHLMSGNGDITISDDLIKRVLNSKIASWTGNNLNKIDEKILQVPIGFCEIGRNRPNAFKEYVEPSERKLIDIVVTPSSNTHPNRKEIDSIIGKNILNISKRLDYEQFLTAMGISKYSICPRGNGVDTHRFTESILMNCIPIVKSSILNPMFEEMGGVIVEDWNQIHALDFDNLPTINRDVITLEYWENRIINHRNKWEKLWAQ